MDDTQRHTGQFHKTGDLLSFVTIDRLLDGLVEITARFPFAAAKAEGRSPAGIGGNDEVPVRVNEDALTEDSICLVRAIIPGPPLIAITFAG
jgi:hypothetical protein